MDPLPSAAGVEMAETFRRVASMIDKFDSDFKELRDRSDALFRRLESFITDEGLDDDENLKVKFDVFWDACEALGRLDVVRTILGNIKGCRKK